MSANRQRRGRATAGPELRAGGAGAPLPPAPPSLPKRPRGRPRKLQPGAELGSAPIDPEPLPPNPGPRAASAHRSATAEAAEASGAGDFIEPQGLDARALVELVAETRALAIVLLASTSRAAFTDAEMAELVTLSDARRRSLEATAPAALPYLNRYLPNAGMLGIGLFGIVVVGSFVEPMRAIKRRARETRAAESHTDATPPATEPEAHAQAPAEPAASTRRLALVEHDADATEPERWPELGAVPPAVPGT